MSATFEWKPVYCGHIDLCSHLERHTKWCPTEDGGSFWCGFTQQNTIWRKKWISVLTYQNDDWQISVVVFHIIHGFLCFGFFFLLLLLLLFFLSPPRQIHRVVAVLGTFTSSWMRWERRSQSGSRGVQLPDTLARCSGHCSCFSKLRTVTHSGDDADAAAAPSDDSTPTTSTTTTTLSLSLSLSLSLCISHHSYGLLVLETFIFPRSACCPDVFLSSVLNLRTIVSRCSGRRWCPRLVNE